MKTCKRCQVERNDNDFPKRPDCAGGVSPRCRPCHRIADRKAYWGNPQKRRDLAKIKNKRMGVKINATRDPFKRRAAVALRNALYWKKIVKPESCSECGWVGSVDGHHEDYSKPLEVIWLCRICHMKRHRKDKELSAPEPTR